MSQTTSQTPAPASATAKPLIVVSADTHIGPRVEEDLRPYCPKDRLDDFDAYVEDLNQRKEAAGGLMGFGNVPRGGSWTVSRRNLDTEGHHDVHAGRLRDLDTDGVAGEIIFHDSQNGEPLPFTTATIKDRHDDNLNFELMGLGRHIYNAWLADFVSVEPERHIGLVQLPIWDVEGSVKEIEWARSVGLRGVNLPYTRSYMSSYNNPEWEPFWDACEDLGMSLCHHGGGAPSVSGGPGAHSIMKLEMANQSRISPLSHFMFGGVFERHPEIRIILTESVGPWWPQVMKEMDSVWYHDVWEHPDFRERVPRLPSEYAADHVFIGASFLARFEADDAIANGYSRNVIWGSDYPHFEGTFQYGITSPDGEPVTRTAQRFTFAGLPPADVEGMLGGNAIRAYGFDEAALQEVAKRIDAPTYDELNIPVDELPDEHDRGHHSFRTFAYWY